MDPSHDSPTCPGARPARTWRSPGCRPSGPSRGCCRRAPLWAEIAFALVTTVPLAVRRHTPPLALAVIVAALLLRAAAVDGPPATVAPFPAILVAAFSAVLRLRSSAVAFGASAGAVGSTADAIALRSTTPGRASDRPWSWSSS
ncbi:hypothetical protein [Nonomuraea sp. SYSU D8015]|uniref:hypothetical protein n=1 Tax=Nonomuraea sp. SYSU D8015 TaxID=2593644 RepID=UPI0016601946|nr:hypothetical protein [Nonomuraea sp. SYSU D8015]